MSYVPPKRSLSASSTKPDAAINWPPTDEELAEYRKTVFDAIGVTTGEPPVALASPALHAASVAPSEALAQLPAGAIAQEPSPPSSSELRYPEFDCPLGAEGPTWSDAEDPTQSGTEDPSLSRIAVAQSKIALGGTSPGEWAAEIARLQALIEGLTQKVEWRITTVTER